MLRLPKERRLRAANRRAQLPRHRYYFQFILSIND
jgi:hypothetical protein